MDKTAGYQLFLQALVETLAARGWDTNVSSLDTDDVYEMWEQGLNPNDIAEELGH